MKLFLPATVVVLVFLGVTPDGRADVPFAAAGPSQARPGTDVPAAAEGAFVARESRFASGETLPTLNLHYRTIGTPRRDGSGVVRNAVLILHGTGGTGA